MLRTSLLGSRVIRQILGWFYSVPLIGRWINRIVTNLIATSTSPRPRPFSLWWPVTHTEGNAGPSESNGPITDYASWPSLTDRTFSGRHLPPASLEFINDLPTDAPYNPETKSYGDITSLFARPRDENGNPVMKPDRSSVLFMFFAQWFTDSVLRIDPNDRRKNTSNHDVDLCQIYGLYEHEARCLRSGKKGRLRSQIINGQEFPDYLGERDKTGKWRVKLDYQCDVDSSGNPVKGRGLYPHGSTEWVTRSIRGSLPGSVSNEEIERRLDKLYATGLERGNSSVGYVALSLVFLREHNRICEELYKRYPGWCDEQLFQTARMINTCLLLKLTVEEYINHIAGAKIFRLDPTFAEKQDWYRINWITLEFNLLYRWHGLVPDELLVDGEHVPANEYRWNNGLLEELGLASLVNNVSTQAAGKIGLHNNPFFLMESEYRTIGMGRDFRLRSYNDYRQNFGFSRLASFDQLTQDKVLAERLQSLYKHIDNLELVVGLFAEDPPKGSLFGELMNTMVAYDAFTQIYTNPLLSVNVHTPENFTAYGLELIESTTSITDLIRRSLPAGEQLTAALGVTRSLLPIDPRPASP